MVTDILYSLISNLKKEYLPGKLLAMVEERVYALLYKGEVYMIYDPLDGFYGIYDKCPTIEDYIHEHKDICIETIKSQGEIYEEELLEIYLSNGSSKENTFIRVYDNEEDITNMGYYYDCYGYRQEIKALTKNGMIKVTYKNWN